MDSPSAYQLRLTQGVQNLRDGSVEKQIFGDLRTHIVAKLNISDTGENSKKIDRLAMEALILLRSTSLGERLGLTKEIPSNRPKIAVLQENPTMKKGTVETESAPKTITEDEKKDLINSFAAKVVERAEGVERKPEKNDIYAIFRRIYNITQSTTPSSPSSVPSERVSSDQDVNGIIPTTPSSPSRVPSERVSSDQDVNGIIPTTPSSPSSVSSERVSSDQGKSIPTTPSSPSSVSSERVSSEQGKSVPTTPSSPSSVPSERVSDQHDKGIIPTTPSSPSRVLNSNQKANIDGGKATLDNFIARSGCGNNCFIHGTNSTIFFNLPDADNSLMSVADLAKRGIAPLSGELEGGGLETIDTEGATAFGILADPEKRKYDLKRINRSYVKNDNSKERLDQLNYNFQDALFHCQLTKAHFYLNRMLQVENIDKDKVVRMIESIEPSLINAYESIFFILKFVSKDENNKKEEYQIGNDMSEILMYINREGIILGNYTDKLPEDDEKINKLRGELKKKGYTLNNNAREFKKSNKQDEGVNDLIKQFESNQTNTNLISNALMNPDSVGYYQQLESQFKPKNDKRKRALEAMKETVKNPDRVKKIDVNSPIYRDFIQNPFPVIFLAGMNEKLIPIRDEYRAATKDGKSLPMKLGEDIQIIAVPLDKIDLVKEYLNEQGIKGVDVVSIEALDTKYKELLASKSTANGTFVDMIVSEKANEAEKVNEVEKVDEAEKFPRSVNEIKNMSEDDIEKLVENPNFSGDAFYGIFDEYTDFQTSFFEAMEIFEDKKKLLETLLSIRNPVV